MATPFLTSLDGLTSPSGLDSPVTPGGVVGADGLPSSKRSTALTAKLTSVLSASYADYETRDALRLLDERGVQNDEDTRRNLKANAQKEVIECNARIVDDFGLVAEQLKRVGTLLATLNSTCDSMRTHILAAKQESAPTLEEFSTLMTRKRDTEMKESLLTAFTTHFLISNQDLNILTSSAEPLDDRFFTVLARCKQIHRDCEYLLGGYNSSPSGGEEEEASSRLGLELLEQTTRNLDAAFKKLYNWIQREFKTLDLEDPNISGSIRRALRVLSERPSLFQNCLDFFAEARRATLAEAFHEALTGSGGHGGGGAGTKAIEFSTHEPLRYVGDMLAWVHSAAVSEKEALEGLFVSDAEEISRGLSAGKATEPWARINSGSGRHRSVSSTSSTDAEKDDGDEPPKPIFDGRKALSELISRNLSLLCQTLQSRIDVAVRTSGDPVLMFKTFNLLDFYRGIFSKLLGQDSSLAMLIQTLQSSTLAQFEKAMEEETSAAVASMNSEEPPRDLTPPVFLATALTQFTDVCRARGPQMSETELERLFASMLSGILAACAESATNIADVRSGSIYKINYMTALKATLVNVSAHVAPARIPLEKAAREIQTVRDQLVEFVTSTFLEFSGVAELMQEIDARRSLGAKARREWLVQNLDEAAQRLDAFLSSALMDAQEAMKNLFDRTLAQDVVAEAVERFCAEYDDLEGMLEAIDAETSVSADEGDGGDDDGGKSEDERDKSANGLLGSVRESYPRTGAEVRALLS
ncbi:uncharacterized protein Z520_01642 [Fonsecaea multimorphosa CBS 102226]|uniref:Conserved oligomeric Golgi complex subunit 6 n=1 Tax=Fonsecaea multimorphosa CBS 102226 TaxID=1442371 RepID=A0A0D2KI67_9EURO|nr:uncharacterized protein Z520_01642 [Fonsecaea multimorphosa CBS 102226]KIY03175.1 hypothetical protein Z520_01642 [Fonsecaea multimorphosa CBS 102226]OAL30418.1 hypothetical protein AYO22_01616 [Fonsecaea multimorphosa]